MDVGEAKCQGDVTKDPKARRVNTGQVPSFKLVVHGLYETNHIFLAGCLVLLLLSWLSW